MPAVVVLVALIVILSILDPLAPAVKTVPIVPVPSLLVFAVDIVAAANRGVDAYCGVVLIYTIPFN